MTCASKLFLTSNLDASEPVSSFGLLIDFWSVHNQSITCVDILLHSLMILATDVKSIVCAFRTRLSDVSRDFALARLRSGKNYMHLDAHWQGGLRSHKGSFFDLDGVPYTGTSESSLELPTQYLMRRVSLDHYVGVWSMRGLVACILTWGMCPNMFDQHMGLGHAPT